MKELSPGKQKVKACIRRLADLDCDAFLISNPVNITYLTGVFGLKGHLLLTSRGELTYFTNFLYLQRAKKIKQWKTIVSNSDVFGPIAKKIKQLKCKLVGFEAENLSFLNYKTISRILLREGIKLLETRDFIEKQRMIKSNKEIVLIKKSIQISEETFEFVKEIFDEKMSEKDLSIEIEKFLRLKGDNEIAFNTIVASGKNTVFPHHSPGSDIIGQNFFLIDLGSKYHGYCADLTRVFFWSKMPILFRKIYDTVRKAHDLSIKKIKEGAKSSDIDKTAREFIDKKGWGKYFGHGLGHGVGLSVHEPPRLYPNSQEILKEGMVVTIEPAIYFQNKFGVRMENMVLVKQKKGEVLSGNVHR